MALRARCRSLMFTRILPWAALAASGTAFAQPVLDHAVSGAQLVNRNGCAIVKISFNFRARYVGHFPLDQGDELRITVHAIDREQAVALTMMRREGVYAPDAGLAAIKAIVFESDRPGGPVLRIQFDHPVAYQVAPQTDAESVTIAVAGKKPSPACKPAFPGMPARPGLAAPVVDSRKGAALDGPRAKDRPPGQASEADLRNVAAWMDEGRAAMRKGNINGAISLFARILKYPENVHSAEAQEMLGLARQKAGQIDEARAEYEDYLRRYPRGEGNERVNQRLAGLITARGPAPEKLQPTPEQAAEKRRMSRFAPPGETMWSISGSASQFYVRDDSFNTVKDRSIAPNPNADPDAHRVHQNMMLSTLDVIGTWANESVLSKVRFSGTNELNLSPDNTDRLGVAALFAEASLLNIDVMGRIGRQTRNTGGVIGRFDGSLTSWQATPGVRFNVVAGSPNYSRFDTPFKDDRYFYGTSVDIGPVLGGVETSLFFIEQRDRSLIDRQAVGAEFRYFAPNRSAMATIDYDVYFQQLNAAIFSGSLTLPDNSTISGGLDYRKVPYLSAWTALQGQPYLTLYDMLRFNTKTEIDRFAVDRTPTYRSANIAYSRPITGKLSVGVDVTATNISGTPPSAGVDGTLPLGTEFYYSAQLIGSSIFKEGDIFIAGARYADLADSNMYVLDFNSRYPLNDTFRLSPRLRFGYRSGKGTDLREYTVLPSILIDYYWTKDISFELEIGDKWTTSELAGIKTNQNELFLTLGVRYDFYAEGRTKKYPAGGRAN